MPYQQLTDQPWSSVYRNSFRRTEWVSTTHFSMVQSNSTSLLVATLNWTNILTFMSSFIWRWPSKLVATLARWIKLLFVILWFPCGEALSNKVLRSCVQRLKAIKMDSKAHKHLQTIKEMHTDTQVHTYTDTQVHTQVHT